MDPPHLAPIARVVVTICTSLPVTAICWRHLTRVTLSRCSMIGLADTIIWLLIYVVAMFFTSSVLINAAFESWRFHLIGGAEPTWTQFIMKAICRPVLITAAASYAGRMAQLITCYTPKPISDSFTSYMAKTAPLVSSIFHLGVLLVLSFWFSTEIRRLMGRTIFLLISAWFLRLLEAFVAGLKAPRNTSAWAEYTQFWLLFENAYDYQVALGQTLVDGIYWPVPGGEYRNLSYDSLVKTFWSQKLPHFQGRATWVTAVHKERERWNPTRLMPQLATAHDTDPAIFLSPREARDGLDQEPVEKDLWQVKLAADQIFSFYDDMWNRREDSLGSLFSHGWRWTTVAWDVGDYEDKSRSEGPEYHTEDQRSESQGYDKEEQRSESRGSSRDPGQGRTVRIDGVDLDIDNLQMHGVYLCGHMLNHLENPTRCWYNCRHRCCQQARRQMRDAQH